jgi:hypothetical protein
MSSKATSQPLSVAELRELGQQLRVDSIRASDVKKSGHPTSSMSARMRAQPRHAILAP